MVEAARISDGTALADEFLQKLEKKRGGLELVAAVAVRFEDIARTGTLEIPRELNELRDDLWEIKAERVRLPFYWTQRAFASKAIRITHGFLKGTWKTPRGEIDKALWVRREDLRS
ncbi:hypothetical protein RMN56_10285 [Micromonospora halotolerans]|uniref:Type II toxin-antitoxin system RelE/ParE family toxin n=1 Tax=Micromonospora halotolerans TaxID=709879 RepID=A0ABZ0A3A6_9ACTN|nr:hypothetical protein [Micromonospora halotolerans]WNM41695.1 hypothetical protein RMN56_10285 [Micromonospora halotolerans]